MTATVEAPATTDATEGKSVLHVMDRTGDTKLMWSADNPDGSRFCNQCGTRLSQHAPEVDAPRGAAGYTPRHLVERTRERQHLRAHAAGYHRTSSTRISVPCPRSAFSSLKTSPACSWR